MSCLFPPQLNLNVFDMAGALNNPDSYKKTISDDLHFTDKSFDVGSINLLRSKKAWFDSGKCITERYQNYGVGTAGPRSSKVVRLTNTSRIDGKTSLLLQSIILDGFEGGSRPTRGTGQLISRQLISRQFISRPFILMPRQGYVQGQSYCYFLG